LFPWASFRETKAAVKLHTLLVRRATEGGRLIERILAHRRERGEEAAPTASLGARAPPQEALF
jgi:hypothetical protein